MTRVPVPVLQGAAWFCVGLITYLSLVPRDLEVRTGLPPGIEHAIAYAGTAGLMVLAYPRQPVWRIALMLFAYSGVMELLQVLSPGRHPGIDGALWSSVGACVGGLASAVLKRRSIRA